MATVSPPSAPKRSNLLWIGAIWGVISGVLLLFIALILFIVIGTIATYTSPGSGADEVIGGLFIGAWFGCFIAILPAVVGGALIGMALAAVAQQRRVKGNGWVLGGTIGVLLYVLGIVVFVMGSGGTVTEAVAMDLMNWILLIVLAIPAALVFGGLSALLHSRAARYRL